METRHRPSPRFVSVTTPVRSYWRASRAPRYSLLFALPLLVLYELLAAALGGETGSVRNAADVILRAAFEAIAGRWGTVLLGLVLIGGSLWLIVRDQRRTGGRLRAPVFAGMLAESAALALVFGGAVALVTAQLLGPLGLLATASPLVAGPIADLPWAERLMISLGAGLYEELLFRVVLVTAIAASARYLLGFSVGMAGVIAVLAGALLFSAAHYVGPFGDPWEITSFTFRFVAGVAFSALYLVRGFGITAWTHALYDVFLLTL